MCSYRTRCNPHQPHSFRPLRRTAVRCTWYLPQLSHTHTYIYGGFHESRSTPWCTNIPHLVTHQGRNFEHPIHSSTYLYTVHRDSANSYESRYDDLSCTDHEHASGFSTHPAFCRDLVHGTCMVQLARPLVDSNMAP